MVLCRSSRRPMPQDRVIRSAPELAARHPPRRSKPVLRSGLLVENPAQFGAELWRETIELAEKFGRDSLR